MIDENRIKERCRYSGYIDIGPGDEAAFAAKKPGFVVIYPIKSTRHVVVQQLFRRDAAMHLVKMT